MRDRQIEYKSKGEQTREYVKQARETIFAFLSHAGINLSVSGSEMDCVYRICNCFSVLEATIFVSSNLENTDKRVLPNLQWDIAMPDKTNARNKRRARFQISDQFFKGSAICCFKVEATWTYFSGVHFFEVKGSSVLQAICTSISARYTQNGNFCRWVGITNNLLARLVDCTRGLERHAYLTSVQINYSNKFLKRIQGYDSEQVACKMCYGFLTISWIHSISWCIHMVQIATGKSRYDALEQHLLDQMRAYVEKDISQNIWNFCRLNDIGSYQKCILENISTNAEKDGRDFEIGEAVH